MNFFQEYLPKDSLKHFIRHYWIYEQVGNDVNEDIITHDGSLNLIIIMKGSILEKGFEYAKEIPKGFILPVVPIPIKFSYRELKCVGINFQPWANHSLLKNSMLKSQTAVIDATKFFEKGHDGLIVKLSLGLTSNEQIISLLEGICLSLVKSQKSSDELFRDVVMRIMKFNGELSIDDICDMLKLTKRGVELKFHKNVGTSPKFFLQKIRFHNFLKQALISNGADLTELAHSSGYYDQSHLIRTSRKFTGLSPSRLVPILTNSSGLNKKINFSL